MITTASSNSREWEVKRTTQSGSVTAAANIPVYVTSGSFTTFRPVEQDSVVKRTNKAPVRVMREAKNHEQLKVWGLRK